MYENYQNLIKGKYRTTYIDYVRGQASNLIIYSLF